MAIEMTEEEKVLASDDVVAACKAIRKRTSCGLGDAIDIIRKTVPGAIEESNRRRAERDAEYRAQQAELHQLRLFAINNDLGRALNWLHRMGVR